MNIENELTEKLREHLIDYFKEIKLIDEAYEKKRLSSFNEAPSRTGFELDFEKLTIINVDWKKNGAIYKAQGGVWKIAPITVKRLGQRVQNNPGSEMRGNFKSATANVTYDIETGKPNIVLIETNFNMNIL